MIQMTRAPSVIPAQAGIQFVGLNALNAAPMHDLDSRLRGNDGHIDSSIEIIHRL